MTNLFIVGTNVFNLVITLTIGTPFLPPPTLVNVGPEGLLPAGTTNVLLHVISDIPADLRYSLSETVDFDHMTNHFSVTGGTNHFEPITGLTNGQICTLYIKGARVE